MKNDNLKRVKGILSAKQGTEVPKFQNSGKLLTKQLQQGTIYSQDGQAWFLDSAFKTQYTDTNSAEFLMAEQQEIIPEESSVTGHSINLNTNSVTIPGCNPAEDNPTALIETAANVEKTVATEDEIQSEREKKQEYRTKVLESGLTQKQADRVQAIKDREKLDRANRVEARLKARNANHEQNLKDATQIMQDSINEIGNTFQAYNSINNSNETNAIDTGVDTGSELLTSIGDKVGGKAGAVMGAVGQIIGMTDSAGQIIRGITGGTDQMTAADKFFDSGIGSVLGGFVNQIWSKKSDAFATDVEALETVGSSYGGTAADIAEAAQKADKKYGLFSSSARRKANEDAKKVAATQNIMSGIADTARDQRLAVQSMGEQAGLAYSMMADGGYNQKYTYAAKHGGVLEWEPDIRLEWEPQIELNWELPAFKDGGSVEFVEELEWIPEFKDGNKIRTIEELIEYAKQKNPRFIQRLSEEPKGIKFVDDEGNETEGSHYLESRGEYVVPRIQEINGELKFLSPQEAIDRAMESGNYLEMTPEEAILFAEKYKQGWPEFFKKFKKGGSVGDSEIPEIEETTQKNVIPEGALHKNKHHMEHAEGLTKKGIPVVDEEGEQQAEIEHSEIIFTLEVTKKLEEYYEVFYSEESTNKEKEQAALDAGKLLVYQILENTEDRTGLIESCKKGGSLTLKKSTDDLIEEVLEWMPTIVIVEEPKEEKHSKKEDKSEAKNEQSEKDKMKEAIREVLIELLIK